MISIISNKEPKLKLPKFGVDGELHNKLNDYEITRLMNKSNFTLFLGRAGSGKTSLMTGLLQTPTLFKKVYETIIVFMPPASRQSMTTSFFDKHLDQSQIFDELNLENLQTAFDIAQENAEEGYKTLFILDDVQKNLKGGCEKLFLSCINNRRHNRLSLWLCCQNYFSIPKQVRSGLTSIFVFKVSKNEMEQIFTEQVEQHKEMFLEVLNICYKQSHDFMFIDSNSQRLFSNWNELVLAKDAVDDEIK
jgi:replication-associated recombination protein RarA